MSVWSIWIQSFITMNAKGRCSSEIIQKFKTIASIYVCMLHSAFRIIVVAAFGLGQLCVWVSVCVCLCGLSIIKLGDIWAKSVDHPKTKIKKENKMKKRHRPWLSVSVIYSAIDAWLLLSRQNNRTVLTDCLSLCFGLFFFFLIFSCFSSFPLHWLSNAHSDLFPSSLQIPLRYKIKCKPSVAKFNGTKLAYSPMHTIHKLYFVVVVFFYFVVEFISGTVYFFSSFTMRQI